MSWSGNQLYFSSDVGGVHNNVWTLAIDQPERPRRMTSGHADEDRASLSADGRWLVYTDNRENATALAVRDLSTGDERLLSISRLDFGEPTGTLRLSVVEKQTGRPLTARLSIQQEGRKYLAPPGSLYRVQGGLLHFYATSHAQATVPAGKHILRAFRGLEYRPLERQIELAPGQNLNVTLELDHWNDPAARSWYSGESHIHANYGYGHWYNTPETMREQLEGEGLKVANFMVANSDGDGVFDREFFRGAPDPLSSSETVLYWNEEFRATLWGHMTLLNLKRLVEPFFTGFRDTTNPLDTPTNADIADATHLQDGHVNFTHPTSSTGDPFLGAYAAKSVPVDVALGKIDSLDINYGEPTLQLWYGLLNCGFRLPASAGTDCFLNRIQSRLPGSDRAYVKIDTAFSYGEWIRNLKAGRSFVTSGPLLEFSVDGKFLGENLQFCLPLGPFRPGLPLFGDHRWTVRSWFTTGLPLRRDSSPLTACPQRWNRRSGSTAAVGCVSVLMLRTGHSLTPVQSMLRSQANLPLRPKMPNIFCSGSIVWKQSSTKGTGFPRPRSEPAWKAS